jgi:hypothetical protein
MAGEFKDYLSTLTADYATTALSVKPRHTMNEIGEFRQDVTLYDDGSDQTITFSTTPKCWIRLRWDNISDSDSDTIMDFYLDVNKAKGMARSFKLLHPTEGRYYTVKFTSPITRESFTKTLFKNIPDLVFRVLGYYAA